MPIWQPDSNAVDGWVIEVPVRSPTLPVNLWIHWSGISADWSGFPPVLTDGHWHDLPGILTAPVSAGDKVLAGQGSMSIASAHREETSIGNTDDWGMALDSVGFLTAPVEGPGTVALPVRIATLGNCFPVAVAITVDLLVLRTSLIPATPAPYGQRPKPNPFAGLVKDRIKDAVIQLARVSQLAGEMKELLSHLEQTSGAPLKPIDEVTPPLGLPRRMQVGLSAAFPTPGETERSVARSVPKGPAQEPKSPPRKRKGKSPPRRKAR